MRDTAEPCSDWPAHKRDCGDFERLRAAVLELNGAEMLAQTALTTFIAKRRMTYEQVMRIAVSDNQPSSTDSLRASSAGLVFIYEHRADRPADPIRVHSVISETAEEVLLRPEFRDGADLAYFQSRVQLKGHRRPILNSSLLRIIVQGQVVETIAQVGVQGLGVNVTGIGEKRIKCGGFDLAAAFNADAFSARAIGAQTGVLGMRLPIWDIRGPIAAWGEHHRHILDNGSIRESTALDRESHAQRSLLLYIEVVFGTLDVARSFKPVRFVATSLARALDRLGISSDSMDAQVEQLTSQRGKLQQLVWIVLVGQDKTFLPTGTATDVHMIGPGSEGLGEDDWRAAERFVLESTRASSAGWFDELKRACA